MVFTKFICNDNIEISTNYESQIDNKTNEITLPFPSEQVLWFVQANQNMNSVFHNDNNIIKRFKKINDIALFLHDQKMLDFIPEKITQIISENKYDIQPQIVIQIIQLQFPNDIKDKIDYTFRKGDITSNFESFNIVGIARELSTWSMKYSGPFDYNKRVKFSMPGFTIKVKQDSKSQRLKEYVCSYILAAMDLLNVDKFIEHFPTSLCDFPVWLTPTLNLLLIKGMINLTNYNTNILCLANLAFWTEKEALNLVKWYEDKHPISGCLAGNEKYIQTAKLRITGSSNLYERIIEIIMFVSQDITCHHKDKIVKTMLKHLHSDITDYNQHKNREKLFEKLNEYCNLEIHEPNKLIAYGRSLNENKLIDYINANKNAIDNYLKMHVEKNVNID